MLTNIWLPVGVHRIENGVAFVKAIRPYVPNNSLRECIAIKDCLAAGKFHTFKQALPLEVRHQLESLGVYSTVTYLNGSAETEGENVYEDEEPKLMTEQEKIDRAIMFAATLHAELVDNDPAAAKSFFEWALRNL